MTFNIHQLTYCLKRRPLIEDISLTFQSGILYGILGPNGSGKSTLLKTMSRIWMPTKGRLFWQGEDLSQFSRIALSRMISLVPQSSSICFDYTVYQMVEMGRYPHGCRSHEGRRYIEEALRVVDAWHLRDHLLSHLSGGERQRVYIARGIATQAPVLLLDEPTSYLDLRHQLEIWQILLHLVQEGKLVIAAVHDLQAAKRYCSQLVILNQGRCQAVGTWGEKMTSGLLKNIFGVVFHRESGIFELDKD